MSDDVDQNTGLLLFYPYRAMEDRVLARVREAGYEVTAAQGRVFARIGPAGTRLSDLAAQAQVTKATAGFIVDQLDWAENTDPNFKDNHYLEPIPVADTASEGYIDRWIVYGRINGEQLFSAKELTIEPRARCVIKDNGAYGLITVQGKGRMNKLALDCPKLIRFHELTEDVAHEVVRKTVVPCLDGRVRREHGARPDDLAGLGIAQAALDQVAQSLDGEERRMAFVHVEDRRVVLVVPLLLDRCETDGAGRKPPGDDVLQAVERPAAVFRVIHSH